MCGISSVRIGAAPVGAGAALAFAVLGVAAVGQASDPAYRAEIDTWRAKREAGLKAEGGWLSVAGLFWLKEGTTRFGSASDNEIVLPASAPPQAGVLTVRGREVRVRLHDGRPERVLQPDKPGASEAVVMGPLSLHLIERGGRLAIRLRDTNAAARRDFSGLDWFPVDEGYRVTAKFVAHRELRPLAVPNILGQVEKMPSPGYAVFEIGGKEHRLSGVFETPGATELFFIFKDQTSGKETYPAGRFLYSGLPKDGTLVLDFNRAYNPPCAFTDFATCPLPPKENWLAARIAAGEKRYGH